MIRSGQELWGMMRIDQIWLRIIRTGQEWAGLVQNVQKNSGATLGLHWLFNWPVLIIFEQSWSFLTSPYHSWPILIIPDQSWSFLTSPDHSLPVLVIINQSLNLKKSQFSFPPTPPNTPTPNLYDIINEQPLTRVSQMFILNSICTNGCLS